MTDQPVVRRPAPRPTPLSQPFWSATKDSKLVMQRCRICDRFVWLPKGACPHCRTETLEWTDISGRGYIYSCVTMHKAAHPSFSPPYTVAVIALEEGPLFVSDIVDIDPSDVSIGMKVQVKFEDIGPVALPHFAPSLPEKGN